jgi:hypothetical protein
MDTTVFYGYTLSQILVAAAVVVGFLILLILMKKVFKKEKVSKHQQIVRCPTCGWRGPVSRYAGRCPKCNNKLGQQKARPVS